MVGVWPRWAGFLPPPDGNLRRLWLGPAAARLFTDEETFCRVFALPAGTVPDRALTAAFHAAGAAMAALYLASPGPRDAPEHRAATREAVGFAIKGALIAAVGRTPRRAGFPHSRPRAPALSAGPRLERFVPMESR